MHRRFFAFASLRTVAIAAVVFSMSGTAGDTADAKSSTELLPAGTTITLVPEGTGSMANLHNVGDPIDFTVKNPVIVNGWVLIPKGAPAHGTIADLTRPGVRFGGKFSQASLKFSFEWVQLVAGKLKLDDTPVEVKGRQLQTKVKTLFGEKDAPQVGIDPFLTAVEYGVDATTTMSVHITSTQRATALEQAEQSNDYIQK